MTTIIIDQAAAERAAEMVSQMPERPLPDVYSGVASSGLNTLCGWRISPADLTPKPAPDGQRVEVTLQPYDAERAEQLSADLGVPLEHVVGAAVCTGLAHLTTKSGGPFILDVTPLAESPIHGPFTLTTEH